eukprot:CAMPEP_0174852052 /NCGR_PEP_ID=MMETSP1114-20130205/25161_1 /TAXON_ID=312471 /ORGANISM="Neobodo designis, Strain CCAP 1951/1" /LENGTH=69 /DNA_ID=CAMNT_0016086627 /DNA_START=77 /DNA_END=286 /DNA_ORIENTATION=+
MSADGKYVHRSWSTTSYALDDLHKNLKTEHTLAFETTVHNGRPSASVADRLDEDLSFKGGRWTDRGLPR